MKVTGIVCLVVCIICVFGAVERYMANARIVRIVTDNGHAFPSREDLLNRATMISGDHGWEPGIPPIALYAGFFALLAGVGGCVLLVKSKS